MSRHDCECCPETVTEKELPFTSGKLELEVVENGVTVSVTHYKDNGYSGPDGGRVYVARTKDELKEIAIAAVSGFLKG